MEELKQKIQALLAGAGEGASFPQLMDRFIEALQEHPDALGALAGSYRLQTTDTGYCAAFELADRSLTLLDDSAKADAVISGSEQTLMAVIRRELNPMTAMFTGKLRIQGSMQALAKFAQLF